MAGMDEKCISGNKIIEKDKKHVWHMLTQHSCFKSKDPIVAVSGAGCNITDIKGNEYLDAIAGLWCVNVGWGRDRLAAVAFEQMKKLPFYPMNQSHVPAVEFSVKLTSLLPNHTRIYFSNSGSEANETAFKIARQYGRQKYSGMNKYKIISRYRAYHGSTLGTLGATGQMERKCQYEPFVPGFLHVPPPYCYRCFYGKTYPGCDMECAYAFQTVIDYEGSETIAAIIVEPVMAGGGVIVPPDEYLPIVEKICEENDVLLIVDEVVNGFCRTGKWFGHHHWNINPDLVVMAKGITSAYMPLAATAATEEVFEKFYGNPDDPVHLRHINTYGGHPVACAVGLENLRIMEEENLCERAARMGEYFIGRLKEMEAEYPVVGQVRGKGLFIGIELVDDKHSKRPASNATVGVVTGHALSRGVVVGRNANTVRNMNNVIILAPPLVISKEEVDRILVVLEEAFNMFK